MFTSRIFGKGERKIAILFNDKGIAIAFAIKITVFRSKRLAEKFDGIFTQIVFLLHEENLVSLKVQYIDGIKIESKPSQRQAAAAELRTSKTKKADTVKVPAFYILKGAKIITAPLQGEGAVRR